MIVLIHNLRPGLKEMHSRRLVYEVVIFIATKHGYCFYEDKNQKPEMIIRIFFAVRSSRTPNRRQTRHNHRSKTIWISYRCYCVFRCYFSNHACSDICLLCRNMRHAYILYSSTSLQIFCPIVEDVEEINSCF